MHDLTPESVQSVLNPPLQALEFVLDLRVDLEGFYLFLHLFVEELLYFVGRGLFHQLLSEHYKILKGGIGAYCLRSVCLQT